MSYYTNAVGRRMWMPEPSLEPPDCWYEESDALEEEEYDRGEDELNGRFNRS